VEGTGRLLESFGHIVEGSSPPALEGATGLGPRYLEVIRASATAAALDAWCTRTGRTIGPDDVEPCTWALAEEGRQYTAVQIHAAYQRLVAGVCRTPEWWAAGFDVLVTLTMAQLPPMINACPTVGTHLFQLAGIFGLFTMPYSFTGQPAISLPLHWSREGLPVGVQLGANYAREDLLLQVAAQLEAARPWVDRYPCCKLGGCNAKTPPNQALEGTLATLAPLSLQS
jgi:amidase